MSEKGAALQTYNQELVKGIENLKRRRNDIVSSIYDLDCQKEQLEAQFADLSHRLAMLNENLDEKLRMKAEYDRAIENSEAAYMKILESSQALLNVLQQLSLDETENIKTTSSESHLS